jgi:hypothetical protein
MMAHDAVMDLCLEKFRQLDKHIEESVIVREDVTNATLAIKHLQESYLDMIVRLEKTEKAFMAKISNIENRLLDRPPAWVGVAFTIMGSIITGLAVYVLTR